jgi:hypothetical protein
LNSDALGQPLLRFFLSVEWLNSASVLKVSANIVHRDQAFCSRKDAPTGVIDGHGDTHGGPPVG